MLLIFEMKNKSYKMLICKLYGQFKWNFTRTNLSVYFIIITIFKLSYTQVSQFKRE